MIRGLVVVFVSIQLFKQVQIVNAFVESCNASLQTVENVTMCPSDKSAYEEAVQKKNCSSLAADANTCKSFQYHCVLSDDLKYIIEVCAPSILTIGYSCTKFSTSHKSIMRIEGFACNDSITECPFGYNSTEAYKYSLCYENVRRPLSTEIPPNVSKPLLTEVHPRIENSKTFDPWLIVLVIVLVVSVVVGTGIFLIRFCVFMYKRRTRQRADPNPPEAIELENRVPAQNRNGQGQVLLEENQDDRDGDHTDEIEMGNRDFSMNRERTSDPLLPEQNTQNNDSLPDGEGATEQLLQENATNNGISKSVEQTSDPSISEEQNASKTEENTDSPRLPKSIPKITPGQDIQHMAVLKTKISTTKKDNNILLQIMVNNLINTLKNPTESWTKDALVAKVKDMVNRLYEREAFGLLDDFCKAINVDETIKKTLPICQKEIFKILDSLENKYHAKINVSDGCVCFTFYFDTNDDLQSFLVKVQEGEEELRKDISDLLLNKTLMEVFHVDSIYVNLVISKVTANKGSVLVYQKDFLKSATAEDMKAEGNIEDVILKKDLPESQKIKLESKFDSVLSSMKNPESMQETNLKTLVEEIVYEVIANKRIDLLTEFATTYEEEETQNALYQHGANMHRTLIPIFEDVNLILSISKKGHLMITDKEAYDEAVANRFRSSQVSLYVGYKFYITRALSFSGAAKWMKSRKQEFAKFGFFYKGTDFSTICFHCGCLKDGWAKEDDILTTHLSLTESCEYANYMSSALSLPF